MYSEEGHWYRNVIALVILAALVITLSLGFISNKSYPKSWEERIFWVQISSR